MKWPTFVIAAMVTVCVGGCGFFGGEEEETPATTVETATDSTAELEEAPALEQEPADDSAVAAREQAAALEQEPAGAGARASVTQRAAAAVDMPWTPTRAGTVDPGMTREQVVEAWGEPMVERAAENWLYMHYRNGCEITCGTDDVVLLQDGQVVDAIVRWQGHTYSGVSSSPPGREAVPTLPSGQTG